MKFPMKINMIIIVMTILLISPVGPKLSPQIKADDAFSSQPSCRSCGSSENITNLSIDDIAGGFGITVSMKNSGDVPLTNITVSIQKNKGPLVRIKDTTHVIPTLLMNESVDIQVDLFGISLGKVLPLLEITIIVNTSEDIQKELRIVTMVFGPFTKILTIYFTTEAFNGYTLFSPEYSKKTYLINKKGTMVHSWDSQFIQGLGVSLLENGDLLRTILLFHNPVFAAGGVTGGVELFDWNGTKQWQYNYSTNQYCLHHGITCLPNGNILMVAWEYKTADQAITAGRRPDSMPTAQLWPDHVIEVQRTGPFEGSIVWEWHVWDHLIQDFDPTKENYGVVEDHPELIDINYFSGDGKQRADWNHINSIDYHEEFDQILLSVKNFHEVWVIDHSTTTAEAAGHSGGNSGKGGDLLYRWGNPAAYRKGTSVHQQLFAQHDASWIKPGCPGQGNILVFNNGQGRPGGQYSSVDELVPPVDGSGFYYRDPGSAYEPEEAIWRYTATNPSDFFAGYLSSAQRLPNGNTLICDGDHGVFFEVTAEKKIVWRYQNMIPNPLTNQVFSIICYAPEYPGLRYLYQ